MADKPVSCFSVNYSGGWIKTQRVSLFKQGQLDYGAVRHSIQQIWHRLYESF